MVTAPALVLERVTVAYGRRVACDAVSFGVAAGRVYALLGREGAGKSSLLEAVAGGRRPSGGRALFEGLDVWSDRRKLRPLLEKVTRHRRSSPEERLRHALARSPGLLLLDDFDFGSDPIRRAALVARLRDAARSGMTILFASSRPGDAEGLADRVGILRAGVLRLDQDADAIREQFRRIRYQNETTETRTDYGTELDPFDAVQVHVRGWGVEAVVSNFSAPLFERFRGTDGVVGAEAIPMSLGEVFDAVSPGVSGVAENVAPRRPRQVWDWFRR